MAILNKKTINKRLRQVIKLANSLGGSSLKPEELNRQRDIMEKASLLATPTNGVNIEAFCLGDMKCEIITPDFLSQSKDVILYSHGGGYTAGGIAYARILATKLALSTGLKVYSYEYRLAPEHKYPEALEDGLSIYNHLLQEGCEADHIILAGDSAGGNLTLCMTQRLLSQKMIRPKCLLLFSPWTDMTVSSESYETKKGRDPILTKEYIMDVRQAYVGDEADYSLALYSPLFGDFTGFPPTLIQVGKNEILLKDSLSLEERIKAAGSAVKLEIYEEGWHVFQQMPVPEATTAMEAVGDYVAKIQYM